MTFNIKSPLKFDYFLLKKQSYLNEITIKFYNETYSIQIVLHFHQ